mgnify:CR=1 FL=1
MYFYLELVIVLVGLIQAYRIGFRRGGGRRVHGQRPEEGGKLGHEARHARQPERGETGDHEDRADQRHAECGGHRRRAESGRRWRLHPADLG